jgi:hypothetical protein
MKLMTSVKNAAQAAWYKAGVVFTTMLGFLLAAPAHALNKTDLTQDISGGKKFEDVASNIDSAAQTGATLIIQLVSIGARSRCRPSSVCSSAAEWHPWARSCGS